MALPSPLPTSVEVLRNKQPFSHPQAPNITHTMVSFQALKAGNTTYNWGNHSPLSQHQPGKIVQPQICSGMTLYGLAGTSFPAIELHCTLNLES